VTHEIHQEATVIDVSADQLAHAVFSQRVIRFAQQVQSLLLRTGVIGATEYADVCRQIEMELSLPDFSGLFFVVHAWAARL
jgi:hypothetical protein